MRAVLSMEKGRIMEKMFKVGDKIVHKVTADALIVYVRGKLKESLIEEYEETKEEAMNLAGIKADSLIENFDFERTKRSIIQYKTIEIEKRSKAESRDLSQEGKGIRERDGEADFHVISGYQISPTSCLAKLFGLRPRPPSNRFGSLNTGYAARSCSPKFLHG